MRSVQLAALLIVSGLTTTAAAQSLATTGTFTPMAPIDPQTVMWVAVDTIRGLGTVSVDVRDPAGSILGAPLNFTFEKLQPQVLQARPSRPLKPSSPLRLEITVRPFDKAREAPVVRAAGLGGTSTQALAAVNVRIDEVKCTGSTCPVCYTLGENAKVTLDTYADVGGKPVRTAFYENRDAAGNHRSEWDRVGDDKKTRQDGRYYIQLHTANAQGLGGDAVSSLFSLPPGTPGACR